MNPLDARALDQLFLKARTVNGFQDTPITAEKLVELYELFKWGPTSMNCQPARFVFAASQAAKRRLKPALSAGNVDKTMAAPATAIVAWDSRFFELLPAQFPAGPQAGKRFAENPPAAEIAGRLNATLTGAYMMLAARALGLSCGPMAGFDNAKVDAEFFPDGRWRSLFLCNLGVGDSAKTRPRGPRLTFGEACRLL
ncbi:MAG: malonic semialdehyde reductase [Gammaproteobacteria bacterium]|nr:malonic semialdehyde reductase [Gammaproteobacteria bacterium]